MIPFSCQYQRPENKAYLCNLTQHIYNWYLRVLLPPYRIKIFQVENTTPAGMCLGAWDAISPYVSTLLYGGNFPWEQEKGIATIHCPDPKGITLELKRIGD